MASRKLYDFIAPAKKSGPCEICRDEIEIGMSANIIITVTRTSSQGIGGSFKRVHVAHAACSERVGTRPPADLSDENWGWIQTKTLSRV